MLITIYVDDLLMASNDEQLLKQVKRSLAENFEMKDIGPIKTCLGIEFHQDLKTNSVFLGQRKYAEEILIRFGMEQCKPIQTPMELNCRLEKPASANESEMKVYPYQNLLGALMYLSVTTRPDIAFTVSFLSQFNSNYSLQHWKAAKRVLRYVKGTINYGLLYKKSDSELYGVADADWGANLADRRSYSGFAFILAGGSISWEARKQRIVSLSTTESEYMALCETTKEALYLREILNEIG
ncbi:uncharacterized protein LOC129250391 [Anastrepha obliqua]|uniref:uncharacterized protein LOC129250391 n=1 Tax=Anastrepha obliqua TaxID=95512 RepID=UPI002408FD14|nr:uncharacterized protein LOC129250391 [Anastrepha obliqua]